MEAMNFQDNIPSFPIDSFEDHNVLVIDLTLMQNASEYFFYPEILREFLRLKLNFTLPIEHVTEITVCLR